MLYKYYVNDNAQVTGEREVHREDCSFLPGDRTYLGEFSNCEEALEKAGEYYNKVDGCYFCCRECHTM